MKTITKILSALLMCLILISTLVSCSKEEVPDGYQLVACEGDCFRLYVPTQWVPNTSSGVTGAYYSAIDHASVTVTVATDAGDMSLDDYWNYCNARYEAELENYKPEAKGEKLALGGQAAIKRVFSASVIAYSSDEGKAVSATYKFMQVFAKYKGKMYVLTYSAPADKYGELLETVEGNSNDEGIIPYFRFADPYVSEDGEKKYSSKVECPEGMKLASTDERAYRFFIPDSWKINNRTGASAAYASDTDRSNVSVQMYMTSDTADTVEKYWARLEESYKSMFESYTLDSKEKIKMSGIDAYKYTFTTVSGGIEYKLVQAIVKKGDMFYTMTYTALAENFDKHIAEFEKMIAYFAIR